MKIGLISDTHSFLDLTVFEHFEAVNEIWHAGDMGAHKVMDDLEAFKPVKAVWGNIDDSAMRHRYPEHNRFNCEGLDVWMTHIGGYPGRYSSRVSKQLKEDPPGLFICGHSHILKVMPDKNLNLLHMNPGAAGHHGFHHMRTLLRFDVEEGRVKNLEVIELGKRGAIE